MGYDSTYEVSLRKEPPNGITSPVTSERID